jgi:hypothetical protein
LFVCVYVLQVFNNNGVVIELCGNICLVVNMWCMWLIFICCWVLLLMKKGNGVLQIGYANFGEARYVIKRGTTPKHGIRD